MEKNALEIKGERISLKPGMLVSAEIKTDKRSVIDYFLSPLRTTVNESLWER